MDFARFASVNARLLTRYGGQVELKRVTPGVPNPDTPWIPVEPVTVAETVQFIATGASAEWVSTGVVIAGDLTGVMAVPVTAGLNPPLPGDVVTAGGKAYTLLRAEPVHSDPNAVLHFAVHGRV